MALSQATLEWLGREASRVLGSKTLAAQEPGEGGLVASSLAVTSSDGAEADMPMVGFETPWRQTERVTTKPVTR